MFKHIFKAQLSWKKNDLKNSPGTSRTFKNHTVTISGKSPINMSAAKVFKGDVNLLNPEDLLVSSLMSCQMMSFLYVCTQHGVEIVSYTDHAEAVLEVNEDGSGRITKVILKPEVKITDINQKDLALDLRNKSHELCFIANSCNFEIVNEMIIIGH